LWFVVFVVWAWGAGVLWGWAFGPPKLAYASGGCRCLILNGHCHFGSSFGIGSLILHRLMEVGLFSGHSLLPIAGQYFGVETSWLSYSTYIVILVLGTVVGYKLHIWELWLRSVSLPPLCRRSARTSLPVPVQHWQRLGKKVRKEIALRVVRIALEKRHAVGSPQSTLLSPISRRPTTRRRLTVELPAVGCVTLNK
jgi:hypothetical protein